MNGTCEKKKENRNREVIYTYIYIYILIRDKLVEKPGIINKEEGLVKLDTHRKYCMQE